MARTVAQNHCDKCGAHKTLTGSYTIDKITYNYRVCPVCYPARMNVHNMLRKLHEQAKYKTR